MIALVFALALRPDLLIRVHALSLVVPLLFLTVILHVYFVLGLDEHGLHVVFVVSLHVAVQGLDQVIVFGVFGKARYHLDDFMHSNKLKHIHLFQVATDEVLQLDQEVRILYFVCMVEEEAVKETCSLGQAQLADQVICIVATLNKVFNDTFHCVFVY